LLLINQVGQVNFQSCPFKLKLAVMNVPELIEQFRNAAVAKGDGTIADNDAELYAQMSSAFRDLVRCGDRGNLAFERLVEDPSPYVRLWVAAQLLFLGQSAGRVVLEEIASQSGRHAFSAKITLSEYDAGRLKSPL
jgi:hypothetical protein